jgi:hypothetical protein
MSTNIRTWLTRSEINPIKKHAAKESVPGLKWATFFFGGWLGGVNLALPKNDLGSFLLLNPGVRVRLP